MKRSSAARSLLRWFFIIATVVLVGVFLIVGFWRPGLFRGQFNAGHQLGGDIQAGFCGNTVDVFQRSLAQCEERDDLLYWECDLRETKDQEIVVFHDWDIGELVPDNEANRKALGVDKVGEIPIIDLTLRQIKSLTLKDGQPIPTLEEVLQCGIEHGMKKSLLLEIKLLLTDTGRDKVLELAKNYREKTEAEIHFLAFRRNISRSFPNEQQWLQKFADAEFRVYQTFRPKTAEYDLCTTW